MSLEKLCINNNIEIINKEYEKYSETILKLNKISNDYIIEHPLSEEEYPDSNFIDYNIVLPSGISNLDKKNFLINFKTELEELQPLTSDDTKNFGGSKNTSYYRSQKCIFKTYDWSCLIICDKEQSDNETKKYIANFVITPEMEPVNCNRYLMETYIKRLIYNKKYIMNILDKLILFYN